MTEDNGSKIATRIKDFELSVDSLRDFVDLVRPVLEKAHASVYTTDTVGGAALALALHEGSADFALSDEDKARLREKFTGKIEVTDKHDDGRFNFTVECDRSQISTVKSAIKEMERRTYQFELLYKTSLVSLVSAAEWFLSSLIHGFLDAHPKAITVDAKQLTFADLQKFDKVEDARKYLVDSVIDSVLRGSFSDWLDFMREKLDLKMNYLSTGETDELIEVYQRRNLLVHNGGVVNSLYLAVVAEKLRRGIATGKQLPVPHDYLISSIANFERFFLLVALDLWKKSAPAASHRATFVLEIVLDHLIAERWYIAESLCQFLVSDAKQSEEHRLIAQMNLWQCIKWQGRFDKIQADVEKADLSAKQVKFKIAKAALLDDVDQVLSLADQAINAREISEAEFGTWPIFRELRKREIYKKRFKLDEFAEPGNGKPNQNVITTAESSKNEVVDGK